MSLSEAVERVFHLDISALKSELSPSVFTWNSVPGVIMLLLLIGIMVWFGRKAGKMIWYGFMLVIMIEILHVFAFSTIGMKYVPIMQGIFKYHVLQSLAQLCVNTPLASGLLFIQEFIDSVVGLAFEVVLCLYNIIAPVFKFAFENIYNAFHG